MSENKTYCCSNRVEVESIFIVVLDLIVSGISLGLFSFISYSYFFEDNSLNTANQFAASLQGRNTFLLAQPETQSAILLMLLFMSTIKICSSCMLLWGCLQRILILLKIWLLPGLILFLYTIVLTFVILYYTREKLLHGFLGAVYLLFQLYLLWIIKLLTKELNSVSTIFDTQKEVPPDVTSISIATELDGKSEHSNIQYLK